MGVVLKYMITASLLVTFFNIDEGFTKEPTDNQESSQKDDKKSNKDDKKSHKDNKKHDKKNDGKKDNDKDASSDTKQDAPKPPKNNTQNTPQSSSSAPQSSSSKTNTYDIKVTFSGKQSIIDQAKQKNRDIGKIALGILNPENHSIDLGNPESNYFPDKVKTAPIPNDKTEITIPKGAVVAQVGSYADVDKDGRVKKDPSTGKIIMKTGDMFNVSISVIGAGMPNQTAGTDLKGIIIGKNSSTDVQYIY